MSDEQANAWPEISALFDALIDLPADERARVLHDVRARTPNTAREVASLLAAHDAADGRFDVPAMHRMDADRLDDIAPADPLLSESRVGAYRVVRKIGEGGMGSVYEAERADDTFHKRVAIKTIARGAHSRIVVSRFQREREILATLQHPNIAVLLDGGVTDSGTPYLVMEYVDGLPIDRWCESSRASLSQRLDLMQQVCRAVQHAHQQLVVHRDLKPQNVLVTPDGLVKLLDFGIARLTQPAAVEGDAPISAPVTAEGPSPMTVAYASPEQLRGEPISVASDVYSLGVMLFELLAGVPPIPREGKSAAQLQTVILQTAPPSPSQVCSQAAAQASGLRDQKALARALAGELDAVVLKAMHADASRRYASADAFAADIQRYLRGQPVSARPDSFGYRARKFVSRNRAAVVIATSLTLALCLAGGAAIRASINTRREQARSSRIANFLEGVLGVADVAALDSTLPRLGPNTSIAALLDAAQSKIAVEFADDAAIRARLYLTIGASYIAQSRFREAARLLDSSRTLARSVLGEHDDRYILASLQAAMAALYLERTDESKRYLTDVRRSLVSRADTTGERYAQLLQAESILSFLADDYRSMETQAKSALAVERQRTPRATLTKALALDVIATAAMANNNVPRADSLYRECLAVLRDLGAVRNVEILQLVYNAAYAAMYVGQLAHADSLERIGERLARETFGERSAQYAQMLALHSGLGLTKRDFAQAAADAMRAKALVDSLPEVPRHIRAVALGSFGFSQSMQGHHATADSALRRLIDMYADSKGSPVLASALIFDGAIMTSLQQPAEALRQLDRAERVLRYSNTNLGSAQLTLKAERVRAYAHQGDTASMNRLLRDYPEAQATAMRAYLTKELSAKR